MSKDSPGTVVQYHNQYHSQLALNNVQKIKFFFDHWRLIYILSIHDFHTQYMESALGFLWSLIKPLVLIGVYAFIFSSVITIDAIGLSEPLNFGLFIFGGMLPWLAVQESLQRGTTVFIDNSNLVKHHTVPLYIFPFSIVLSVTISAIMAVIGFIMLKLIIDQTITYHCILILVLIPVQVAFCYGLSLMIGTLNVFLRDISHMTTTILFVWFFFSPIIYPAESLPQYLQSILWFNPLTSLTAIYRDLLIIGCLPSIETCCSFLFFTLFSLCAGLGIYFKARKEIVDWI